jgi:monoterpene epsilon-lactone hydrolase
VPSLRSQVVRRSLLAAIALQRRRGAVTLGPDASPEQVEAVALRLRTQWEELARRTVLPGWVDVAEVDAGGVPGEWVAGDRSRHDRVLLHLHGGGYFLGSPRTHRGLAAALSRSARARVLLPDYRLAPEHPFPAALDDTLAAYRFLLDEVGVPAERIAVSGDSAGGGLGLALLVRLREDGLPLPACYVGFSPWTDLAGTGESMTTHAGRDPWLDPTQAHLPAKAYAGAAGLDHPLVSPLYADLSELPPLLVQVGSEEILLDDARRVVARARTHGSPADVRVYDGMWHVFQAFPGMPESRWALREAGAFIRRHVPTRGALAA